VHFPEHTVAGLPAQAAGSGLTVTFTVLLLIQPFEFVSVTV
jgi:hypothetical protein